MKRGDVVQIDWPFSDQTGSKIRPAVVVQADYLVGITDDTVLVQITSKIHGIPGTEVILDPTQEPMSGLKKKCVATCSKIMTFDENLIQRKVGILSDATMQVIDECLKSALGLQ
jgi:mRNA interferase MazF